MLWIMFCFAHKRIILLTFKFTLEDRLYIYKILNLLILRVHKLNKHYLKLKFKYNNYFLILKKFIL
jgi:hypothetical protein